MSSLEKIEYLTHLLEITKFSQAKKILIIISIILAVLIILKIILKDFENLKSSKKLVNFLFVIAIIVWIGSAIYFAYRYYPVYLYEHDYTEWKLKLLEDTIKSFK